MKKIHRTYRQKKYLLWNKTK